MRHFKYQYDVLSGREFHNYLYVFNTHMTIRIYIQTFTSNFIKNIQCTDLYLLTVC